MASIFNSIRSVSSQAIGYAQHGLCYAVEKCGSAMQVGGVLILGVEVSNYAKENKWWTQSATTANLSGQTGKFSAWYEMDPKWLGIFLVATGSVFSFVGNYGKMDIDKIRELNNAIENHTRLLGLDTAAENKNTAARKKNNETISATIALVAQEDRAFAGGGEDSD